MIEKREETRKNYDHYDKKMEELFKFSKGQRNEKINEVISLANKITT